MRNGKRSGYLGRVVGALGLLLLSSANAAYPEKPIRLIVPFGAGSGIDLVARSLANGAEKQLGQAIVVENKAGAGGVAGLQYMMSKPADGYAIAIASINPFVISHHAGTLNAHPVNDFTCIMRSTGYLFGVAVRAESSWKSVADLIQYSKANPGKLSYASSGVGSTGNLNMEEFASLAGIQVNHVPYKSGNESNTALLGGHVDALSDGAWAPLEKAGKFRTLLIYANDRASRYPAVPVPREVVSANVQPGYLLLLASRNVPKSVIAQLNQAFRSAMSTIEHKEVLEKFNMEPLYLDSDSCNRAVSDAMGPLKDLAVKVGLGAK